MLYERDYRILTVEEQARWAAAEKRLHDSSEKGVVSTTSLLRYWKCLPQAVPYYTSLFPNHLLGIDRLEDTARLEALRDRFAALLDGTACTERQVLEFIRTERAWPLVGAILHHGCSCGFGHHEAYLFREFPLGTNYVADYLLVGKGSGGYEFLFVELESPQGAVTTRDGGFGAAIRKGIAQAESWRRWLDAHFMLLQAEFEKHLGTHRPDLPREFRRMDRSRLHFAVVAGRRTHYGERTYALRRELRQERDIALLHYDNLTELLDFLKEAKNY